MFIANYKPKKREIVKDRSRKIVRQIVSYVLSALFVFTMPMLLAFADSDVNYLSPTVNDGAVTFATETADSATVITENSTALGGEDSVEYWYVVPADTTVEITDRITVSGDVHLILADGSTLIASAGITVEGDNGLTIYAQSTDEETMGILVSTATTITTENNATDAGIGGTVGNDAGAITINGGNITSTGGNASESGSGTGAGLGGGGSYNSTAGSGGIITINGGAITAMGGATYSQNSTTGAGIGGGSSFGSDAGDGGIITIYGGTITAIGGQASNHWSGTGSGIGGGGTREGSAGDGGDITIYGGVVTATGGTASSAYSGTGAGIGGGGSHTNTAGSGGSISINGGIIIATGGADSSVNTGTGAGIGGGGTRDGTAGSGGSVTINDGTITASGGSGNDAGAGIGSGRKKSNWETSVASSGTLTINTNMGYVVSSYILDGELILVRGTGEENSDFSTEQYVQIQSYVLNYKNPIYETNDTPSSGIENFETVFISNYTEINTNTTEWNTGYYTIYNTVSLSDVTVSGDVFLILEDGAALTVSDGITVENGASLTIYAQSTGSSMGTLLVTSIGIGGAGEITINGGAITSNDIYGDGITGNIITINSGIITVMGSDNGINGDEIIINAGTITATSYGTGNGINGDIITINNGTISAIGGDSGNGIIADTVTISNTMMYGMSVNDLYSITSATYGTGSAINEFSSDQYTFVGYMVEYMDLNGETIFNCNPTVISTNDTQWNTGWYVIDNTTDISSRIEVIGDVCLILADDVTLNASSGITVEGENSLTIYAQSDTDNMGKLNATAAYSYTTYVATDAGIGGTAGNSAGTITINGGNITATGGALKNAGGYSASGAGIGGGGIYMGDPGSGGVVTINGGIVTATGGSTGGWYSGSGAGIGGGGAYQGATSSGGTVTINGGIVVATGGSIADISGSGAGIGGGGASQGVAGSGGIVTITGGTISASGGGGTYSGTGIGSGGKYSTALSDSGTVTISDYMEYGTSVNSLNEISNYISSTGLAMEDFPTDQYVFIIDTTLLESVSYLDENGAEEYSFDLSRIYSTSTDWNNDWYVVIGDVTIDTRITVTGDVHIILTDGATLNANAGITVEGENSLTIYAQSTDETTMGKLIATASSGTGQYSATNAGIGGTAGNRAGTITINGGMIEATGGSVNDYSSCSGAGIGSGGFMDVSDVAGTDGVITINGGNVTATGGSSASLCGSGAGIGGGGAIQCAADSGGIITISGGVVTATGGSADNYTGTGAGIGGGGAYYGSGGSGGTILITGGTIEATGGAATGTAGRSGAGIGGGGAYSDDGGDGGDVTIYGGIVIAAAGKASGGYGSYGAGIGGGAWQNTCGTMTLGANLGYGTSNNYSDPTSYTLGSGSPVSDFSTDVYVKIQAVDWSIITQPTGGTYTYGATITELSVNITEDASGTFTYQWYSCDDVNESNAAKIEDATSATYTPSDLVVATYYYYCAVSSTSDGITITSDISIVTIEPKKVTAVVTTETITKVYDTDTTATVAWGISASDLVNATDKITVTTTATYASANVADSIGVSFSNLATSGAQAGCYDVTLASEVTGAITTRTVSDSDITITLDFTSYTYDGTAKMPSVSIVDDIYGNTIAASEYTVTYSDNVNAGTATVTITDATGGNYAVSGSTTFAIVQSGTDFGDDDLTVDDDVTDNTYTYGETMTITITPEPTGTAIVTAMSLYDTVPSADQMALFDENGSQLCAAVNANTDGSYTLTYNTTDKLLAVGTHVITAKYVGNDNMADYSEEFAITIIAKSVTAQVTTNPITKVYDTGTSATAVLGIAESDLADSTDIVTIDATATYASADIAEGIAIGFSNLITDGAQAGYYNVSLPVDITGSITTRIVTNDNITITLDINSYVYDGTSKTPSVSIADNTYGNTIAASEYTITYSNNTNAGVAVITITDVDGGNYNIYGSANFSIVQSSTSFGDDNLTVDDEVDENTYTYGDTINITITPEATGEATVQTNDINPSIALFGLDDDTEQTLLYDDEPVIDQMALFDENGSQLCAAVNANTDGSYTLTYNTVDKLLAVGTHVITAKYVGNDNMADYSETFEITIIAKSVTATRTDGNSITKVYDTDNTVDTIITWAIAEGDLISVDDDVTITSTANYSSTSVSNDISIVFSGLATSGVHASYYNVSLPTEITGNITPYIVSNDNITITLDTTNYTYNGSAKTPSVSITDNTYGYIFSASEYTVSYSDNVSVGTATVTVSDVDGGNYNVSGSTTFTISAAATNTTDSVTTATSYVVTLSASVGGTLAPELSDFSIITMQEGTSYTFNITPNSGYAISAVYVDGTNIGAVSSYTIESIVSNRSIHVDFVSVNVDVDADDVVGDVLDDIIDDEEDMEDDEEKIDVENTLDDEVFEEENDDVDDTIDDLNESTDIIENNENSNNGSVLPIAVGVVVVTTTAGGAVYFIFKRKFIFGSED